MMSAPSLHKVVILDRDGTIVVDRGYLADPDGLEFLPGAAEGLRWLWERGYRLVVITNQSGVGRGLFSIDRLEAMNARLHAMIEQAGAKLTKVYFCPHTPDADCVCRKPKLELMEKAATELNFDPHRSVVIGDKESDIEFGIRAGARTVLIYGQAPQTSLRFVPDVRVPTLMDAARSIT